MYYFTVSYTYNISIITHNRPALLENTINSVVQAVSKRDISLYVIWQNPNDVTTELTQTVLDKFKSNLTQVIVHEKKYAVAEENIDLARIKALNNAFSDSSIIHAIVLEDDVRIATDCLAFFESAISHESSKVNFRGINFGSKEEIGSPNAYSRIRYGIHGPASAISRKTWKNSGLANFGEKSLPRTWDGYIEPYLKTGFMVTPNLSRYIDFGAGGTHSSFSNKDYFNGLQKSFDVLSKSEKTASEYFHEQIPHTWRFDSKTYFAFSNAYYLFRFFLVRMRDHFEK